MQCPGCGRPVSEQAKFCPTCGHAVGANVALVQPSVSSERKGTSPTIVAVVIIVVVLVVVGVTAMVMMTSSTHDLRADLSFTASNSWLGFGSSGDVDVWGYVYNYGSSDCLGTLHLKIFDGYTWHEYTELLGLIRGNGGNVFFEESYYFNSLDADAVQVNYELTGD